MDRLEAGVFGGYHPDPEGVVVYYSDARREIYRRDIIIRDLVGRLLDMGEDVQTLLKTIVDDTKSEWIKSQYSAESPYPQVQEAMAAVDNADKAKAAKIMAYVEEHGKMPPEGWALDV